MTFDSSSCWDFTLKPMRLTSVQGAQKEFDYRSDHLLCVTDGSMSGPKSQWREDFLQDQNDHRSRGNDLVYRALDDTCMQHQELSAEQDVTISGFIASKAREASPILACKVA